MISTFAEHFLNQGIGISIPLNEDKLPGVGGENGRNSLKEDKKHGNKTDIHLKMNSLSKPEIFLRF